MTEEEIPKMLTLATVTPTRSEQDTNVTNIDGTVMNVFNAQIIRALIQGFGIPFKIVMPADDSFGIKMTNGTWSGVIGMLARGEADLSVSGFTMHNERREVVNFTLPMYISDVSFMTNKPEPYPKKFAIFDVFFYEIWIVLGVCLILISYILYMLLKRRQACHPVLVDTIGTLLEKPFCFKVRYKNAVSLFISWFLTAFVLITIYKAVILSVMTFPRMDGIRDISDLAKAAKEKTITCISYKGGEPSVAWLEANDERLEAIEECRRRSEMEGIHGQPGFLKYTNRKAFIADRLDLITYARDYFVSDDSFILSHIGIAYSKNFCCPRKLEKVVRRIVEADLYAKTLRDREYMAQLRLSSLKSDKRDRSSILDLTFDDFSGAFLVLALGHTVCLLVFMIEILGKHPRRVADNFEKGKNNIANDVEKVTDNVEKVGDSNANDVEKVEDSNSNYVEKVEDRTANDVEKVEDSNANDVENVADNYEKY